MVELHSDATGEDDSEWPTAAAVNEDSGADSSDSDTDVLDNHEKNLTTMMRKDKTASVWQHDCHLCGQTCPSSNALRMHKKRKHRE